MSSTLNQRDHGGGLDAAAARHGGARSDWLDLSTGINPVPYPAGDPPAQIWTALPDTGAMDRLLRAARAFWTIPDSAQVVAGPGTSALIAQMPALTQVPRAFIPGPTYNEHAAAFRAHGVAVSDSDTSAPVHVHVSPNNPDGRIAKAGVIADHALTIIDESFCDTCPDRSLIGHADRPGVVILKSFGKFWGLAGLRLGFAIGHPDMLAPRGRASLTDLLGPWAVSGPALDIGARALADGAWAERTRARLTEDAARLDALMTAAGAALIGGTSLFRTYAVDDAITWQDRLARHRIWTRIFPYSTTWIRCGLPGTGADWSRLETALA